MLQLKLFSLCMVDWRTLLGKLYICTIVSFCVYRQKPVLYTKNKFRLIVSA